MFLFHPLTRVLRPQSFDLVLDTGSSDLWFATSGCTGCSQGTPVFNPTKSTSFQLGTQRVPLNYGSGSASGILARDTVTMGPFTVNPQVFGVYFPPPPPSPHFHFLPHTLAYLFLVARVINAKSVLRSGGYLQTLGAKARHLYQSDAVTGC
jgi:hypothetical protein